MSVADAPPPDWEGAVLDFWFRGVGPSKWFSKDAALDASIRDRFQSLHSRLMRDEGIAVERPRPTLAAVIVLDQFSRNMFRDTPRAFASDELARRLAREAVRRGLDRGLTRDERLFLYLPFEHSEDCEDQALSVELIRQLGNENLTKYAEAHKAIIDRFGRFPHRNAILGRVSTPDEIDLLKDPMGSF
jgi:uncharacterized protein (DUF924 family)